MGAALLHFVWLYLFVIKWHLGVFGFGLASALTFLGMLITIEVYSHLCLPRIKESLVWPSRDVIFQDWGEYLRLGIPSAILFCAEYWAFGVLVPLSGNLGVAEQAAMVIIYQINNFPVFITVAICDTSITLVGNQIGANNVPLAKRYAKVIFCLALAVGCLNATVMFTWREAIASLFTSDRVQIDLIVSAVPSLCIFALVDSVL